MDLDTLDRRLRLSLWLLALISGLAIVAYFIWFGLVHSNPLSEKTGTWGEFGDFLGGFLNPLVAACALYWLTMSVRLQKDELGATREELRLTREEHAASRNAQERQARVALVTSQLETLNMRLSAISGKLTYYREALTMWVQHSNLKNVHYQVKCADGENRKIDDVIAYTLDKVRSLEAQQEDLLQQIEALSKAAEDIPSSAVQ